ncbi:MAG: hypothetical protein WEE51_10860 [Pirellulaceae bacterium]
MHHPPGIDENPFASPQEAGSSDLFCLTVGQVRIREFLQALVALLIACPLAGLLWIVSEDLMVASPGWASATLLWALRLGVLATLMTVLNHLYRMRRASTYLPIRLTADGIEARCELRGDPQIISWAWPDVVKLKLTRERTLIITSRDQGKAYCDLRYLGRSDYNALREAARSRDRRRG